jgi:hypothetical protein
MDVTFDQIKKQYAVEVERANTLESPEAARASTTRAPGARDAKSA